MKNTKSLFVFVMMSAFTLLQSPAQQPQAPIPSLVPQSQAAIPEQITVNVIGQVNRPARITLPKGSGLLDAIASVGGLTRMANSAKITVIHKSAGQRPDSVKIDLRPILSGAARDVILRDGDTINVGQAIF